MKKLPVLAALLTSFAAQAGFIHPLEFNGSEAQKQEVINFIQSTVKADYCEGQLDMCQPTMLRMMEQENLTAFKKLTQANDREVLDRVIKDYCDSGLNMCNYAMIEMMYQENEKASNKKLTW